MAILIIQIQIVIFLGVLLLIGISNLWSWRRMEHYPAAATLPRVSILLPARNEEDNIAPCTRSLLAQDYPDFEVLVLNDASTDRTGEILAALAREHSKLRILQGQPLPDGWFGKHWACHQLAQAATGDLLLFTDADTRHQPQALRNGVNALSATKADLLTAMPRQEVHTWSEQLFVPLLPWSIFAFLQVHVAHRMMASPIFSATIGQYMLFRQQAYEAIGGHAAVRQNAVDDMALGRRIKAHGLSLWLVDGSTRVHCRMYHNVREVYEGFSKNMFAAFGYNIPFLLFAWTWLSVIFWLPLLIVSAATLGRPLAGFYTDWAIAACIIALLSWGLSHLKFQFPLYLTLLYPFTILFAEIIAIRSLFLTRRGRATWKGRVLRSTQRPTTQSNDK